MLVCLLSTYSVIGVIAAIFTLYKLVCALLYFSVAQCSLNIVLVAAIQLVANHTAALFC